MAHNIHHAVVADILAVDHVAVAGIPEAGRDAVPFLEADLHHLFDSEHLVSLRDPACSDISCMTPACICASIRV